MHNLDRSSTNYPEELSEILSWLSSEVFNASQRAYPGFGGVPLYETSRSEKVTEMKKDRHIIPVQEQ
jgi:hypothetical protein